MLQLEGNKKSVRQYNGKFETVLKSRTDTVIRKVQESRTDDTDLVNYQGRTALDLDHFFADLQHVANALNL